MSDAIMLPGWVVPPDVLDAATESTSFNLKVPEHARGSKAGKFWTELLDCYGAEIEYVEPGFNSKGDATPKRWKVVVRFKVAAESQDETNIGRVVTMNGLLPYEVAVLSGPACKEKTMGLMTLGKLKQFLIAAGLLPEDTSGINLDINEYFAGDAPAVQGAKVYALFKSYIDKQDKTTQRQDITHFDSLEAGEANAA